ncbi:hypothetical protein SAMN05443574_102131 [Haloarcula vallismortis]|uniref:Envelope protein N-terminal domain-containing protein n=2 Tax=Haloarcula vallismortis TaxID=28442 RepID=M0JR92_HALVA|nr:hypothetical protein [Haloarcula vallismortis]EMA10918.1 hypothetical protein C437_02762 [Haloarcula vallismortis ATCC 29715]SDW25087.1 hypothetical protein SAMN05443574_102131 [Haloarcula vallismortis]
MTRARSVLLAALIVCSAVVGTVGPALAQSTATATDSGPVTKTFETGPHKVKIDLFDVSSETTITVITDESPAGNNTAILKKTVSGSQNSAHFRNAGAYESFTIRVEGADGPVSFSKGGPAAAWTPGDDGKFLGDTGGDAGFTYDLSESIGESVMPSVVQLDRTGLPGSTTVNTTGTDAEQTKIDIYQSAQNSKAQSESYQTTLDNYLSDTKTQARIIGKNAYIKALNNGSSKAAAKTEAKSAVADYYAVKQVNLANQWNAQVDNLAYLQSTADSETSSSKVVNIKDHDVGDSAEPDDTDSSSIGYDPTNFDAGTEQLSLVNGSSTSTGLIDQTVKLGGTDNPKTHTVGLTTGPLLNIHYSNANDGAAYDGDIRYVRVTAPNSNYDELEVLRFEGYANKWSEIQSQNTQVQNDMDTLAENTYSAYQQGEINSSDLVDPYVLASQQSAGEDFQGWTAAQLTLMGTNSPENFDQIGSFNITTESGTQYEGVLFSQENPASGQFENGTTYNTSNIGGTQYVVTSDRIVELDGEFTIDRITTTSGETTENVTIQKTTYETTNVTELKQQYEDLAYKRAQIEAREQAMQQSAGGGFLGGGSVPPVVALAIIGTLLAIVVLQN